MLYLIVELLFYLLVTALLGVLVGWLAKGWLGARRKRQIEEASRRKLRHAEARVEGLKNQLVEASLVEQRLRDELSRLAEGTAAAGPGEEEAEDLRLELARRDKKLELLKLQLTQSEAALASEWRSLNVLKSELAERQKRLAERGKRMSDKLRGSEDASQQLRLQLRSMKRQEGRLQQEVAASKQALAGERRNSSELIAQLKEKLEEKETMAALSSVDQEPDAVEESQLPVEASTEEVPRDDLQRIRGIGPVLRRRLNEIGITSFQQIAAWTDDDVAEVASRIGGGPGRIRKCGWVATARKLMGDRSRQGHANGARRVD